MGRQTANNQGLDCDIILVAHADGIAARGDDPVVATTNVRHLALFTRAEHWRDIQLSAS